MPSVNILFVEDDEDFAETSKEILEMRGYTVHVALTGEEAILKFRDHEIDFLFIDIKLPNIDGFEVMRAVRQIRPDVKAVMMTGFNIEKYKNEAKSGGALDVLEKPLDFDMIIALLESAEPNISV